jgi:hypothetical protein
MFKTLKGETWNGLQVHQFTGERFAIIDRSEVDFDGQKFVCFRCPMDFGEMVCLLPESLEHLKAKICEGLWRVLVDSPNQDVPIDGVTIDASAFEYSAGTEYGDDLQLHWPEFQKENKQ